jgi:hypothetical protein
LAATVSRTRRRRGKSVSLDRETSCHIAVGER